MTAVRCPVRGLTIGFLGAILLSACGESHQWKTADITDKMPDLEFELTDGRGRAVTEEDFAGTVRLLFFGFTSCPDVCPTTLAQLTQAVDALPAEQRAQVRVLFVSVDPQRDSPKRLAKYTDAFGDYVVGLTADEAALRALTKRYASTFSYDEPDAGGDYGVSHTASVFVFGEEGDARLLVRANDPVEAVTQDLAALL